MKIKIMDLLILCSFICLLIVPGSAITYRTNPPDEGFVNDTAGFQYYTYYNPSSGGLDRDIQGLYMYDTSFFTGGANLVQFNYFMHLGCVGILNKTSNSSWTNVNIYKNWVPVGTGQLGYTIDRYNTVYIYLSLSSWNQSYSASGYQYFNMTYDKSKFDIVGKGLGALINTSLSNSVGLAGGPGDGQPGIVQENLACTPVGSTLIGSTKQIIYTSDWYNIYTRTFNPPFIDFSVAKGVGSKIYNGMIILDTKLPSESVWTNRFNETSLNTTIFQYLNATTDFRATIINPANGNGEELTWLTTMAVSTACNITATSQNTANGNAVQGSTFHIYDITKGTSESFYLPFGTGSISIPYMYDYYSVNATKTGYTGYIADPVGQIPRPGYPCTGIHIYTDITGPPTSVSNCTLSFTVEGVPCSDYNCVIPNAQVSLSDGQATVTNYAGYASFTTAKNTTYDYTISKTDYQGVGGTIDIGNDDAINIPIELSSGTIPTATTTTYAPSVPHDTTNEALDFLKQNTLNIVMLFFVVTIIGAIKLMSK